jgi:phosphopantetheinyl transferase (holo-ACP synthase)
MKQFPKALTQKLQQREASNALRKLPVSKELIDFASNDYLGFSQSETIFNETHEYLLQKKIKVNGATGSRLISGNHNLYPVAENAIAEFHDATAALIFNSGYDANVGFFSSVAQRNDVILYDELCHASIRDGIQMSNAKSYKFQHNDLDDLESIIKRCHTEPVEVSISHSFRFSTIIISDQKAGIDIEMQREKILKIADKFVNNQELQRLKAFDNEDYIKKLTTKWGAKEAIFKIRNEKGISFKDHIQVNPFEITEGKTTAMLEIENTKQQFAIYFEEVEDFTLVYAFEI